MSFSKLFQGIVDLHDGKISVHSDEEGGLVSPPHGEGKEEEFEGENTS